MATVFALALTATLAADDGIPWITDLAQARRVAEQQQRLVLLHFWGDGCAPCQQLENNVFNQPELIRVLSSNFVCVKVHVQQQPNIASHYKITQIPTDIVVLPSGVQVFRTTSPANVNAYIAMLDQVRANALANGYQQVDRVANKFSQQLSPYLAALPPRPGEEGLAPQSLNTESSLEGSVPANSPSWRNAPVANANAAGATPQAAPAASGMMANQFVAPSETPAAAAAPASSPSAAPAPSGSRYGNPYLHENIVPATPSQQDAGFGNRFTANPADAAAPAPRSESESPTAPEVPLPGVPAPTAPSAPAPAAPAGTTPPQAGYGNQSWNPAPATTPPAPAAAVANPQAGFESGPATAPRATSPVANPPQLPPGVPPLALDGHCPVTLMNLGKWEKGDPRFGVVHRDRTYLFKSQIERDRFLAPAAADRFAPVLSGLDPVRFAETGQAIDGRREHGVLFDGQIYLFADEDALVRFEQQPHRYVAVVRQAMANARNQLPQR